MTSREYQFPALAGDSGPPISSVVAALVGRAQDEPAAPAFISASEALAARGDVDDDARLEDLMRWRPAVVLLDLEALRTHDWMLLNAAPGTTEVRTLKDLDELIARWAPEGNGP